jgi:hypothetical protein
VGSSFGPSKWTSRYLSTSKLSPVTLPLCSSEGTCSRVLPVAKKCERGKKPQTKEREKRERERKRKEAEVDCPQNPTQVFEDDPQETLPPLFWRFQCFPCCSEPAARRCQSWSQTLVTKFPSSPSTQRASEYHTRVGSQRHLDLRIFKRIQPKGCIQLEAVQNFVHEQSQRVLTLPATRYLENKEYWFVLALWH